jgi:putative hydrolase of the HAD superfamily
MTSSKVIIFDLDDTLYRELDFFEEGLFAVANYAEETFGLNAKLVYSELMDVYKVSGRNQLFNAWLMSKGLQARYVSKMVGVYRYHPIQIKFPSKNVDFLNSLRNSIYLITDGNKLVQNHKIQSFGLKEIFKKCFITNQYGLKFQKPSLHSFDLIRKIERTSWSNMIYVGDNPAKDFFALNSVGGTTIQTFEYRPESTRPHFSIAHTAKYSISSLQDVDHFI